MLPPLPGVPGLHVNRPKDEGNIRTRGKTKLQGPDIKCFVLFLEFHFNSNTTGANENRRLGTYKNTILILKTTEWMICKVLILSASFSTTSFCFSSGITLKIVTFKLESTWGFIFVSCVHSRKRKLAVFFQCFVFPIEVPAELVALSSHKLCVHICTWMRRNLKETVL